MAGDFIAHSIIWNAFAHPTMGETRAEGTNTTPLGVVGYGVRPILSDDSTVEKREDEIEWIQTAFIDIFSEHYKVVTI